MQEDTRMLESKASEDKSRIEKLPHQNRLKSGHFETHLEEISQLQFEKRTNKNQAKEIEDKIKNKKLIYNYKADQRTENKFENNETLNKLDFDRLPYYIRKNKNLFKDWL